MLLRAKEMHIFISDMSAICVIDLPAHINHNLCNTERNQRASMDNLENKVVQDPHDPQDHRR
jgi:hypothetical protein